MLVFFDYPRGSTIIDGQRIYGFLEPYDPVRVSWDVYKANEGKLLAASYDWKILSKMFPESSSPFPRISFTYHQIRYLEWEDMCALCKAFGITTKRSKEGRRKELRKFIKENC